jgi:hypothetical protein
VVYGGVFANSHAGHDDAAGESETVALVVAEEPGACTASLPAQISSAWWCMVVYGGVFANSDVPG